MHCVKNVTFKNLLQVGTEAKRRLTMDGNFNLVHRAASGHSVHDPLHLGHFFLDQALVDEFVSGTTGKSNESQVLSVCICIVGTDKCRVTM